METIAASQIADSQTARLTDPALANLLAVEARHRIDIELTRANLARNTLSPSAVRVTRVPPGANAGDFGPDASWSVFAYRASEAQQSTAAPKPTPSGNAARGYVEDFDNVTQRPGDRRYDVPAPAPNVSFADPGPWVDLSDDGSRLVVWYGITGPNRHDAIVLDALTFEPVGDPIPGPISGVAINPDGSLLVVGRPGGSGVPLGTIDLITPGGEIVGSLPSGGDGQIDGVQFSGDGSRLVTQQFKSDRASVKVWDVVGEMTLFTKSLGAVFFAGAPAISQDGRLVAVVTGGDPTSQGGASGLRQTPLQVTVLDTETAAVVAEIRLDTFSGNDISVDFGAVEPVLAIGDPSGVTLMSTKTFEVMRRMDQGNGAELGVWFRDADRALFAQGGFGPVLRFDLTVEGTGSIALPVAGLTSLSPIGDTIAVVELGGSLSFWSAGSKERIGTADLLVPGTAELGSTHKGISGIGGVPVFSADGALLYVRDADGRFSVVDVSSADVVGEVDLTVGRTHNALAVSASGAFIATGHSDGRVMLWDAASFGTTAEPVAEFPLFDRVGDCDLATDPTFDGIRQLSIMESGSVLQLRVVDQCGDATGWDVVDGTPSKTATFPNSLVVDFGPDEAYLTSQTGTRLRLLADDGAEIRSFDAHHEDVLQTSTSHDLGTMASVSRDTIGLWYTRSGEFLASGITGAQAHVAGDGSFAVTSGGAGFDWFGGPVVVWDLDPDTWEEQACLAAGRNFSLFEWQQFFPDDAYRVTCSQWPSGLGG